MSGLCGKKPGKRIGKGQNRALPGEAWKGLVGTRYEVSSCGRIRRWPDGAREPQHLTLTTTRGGYKRIRLAVNGKNKSCTVHALVLTAFAGPRPTGHHGAHLNGNPSDNRIENLRWVTPKENMSHKVLHGTHLVGERIPWTKLTTADVIEIKSLLSDGYRFSEVAARFGINAGHVKNIYLGKTWAHLEGKRNLPRNHRTWKRSPRRPVSTGVSIEYRPTVHGRIRLTQEQVIAIRGEYTVFNNRNTNTKALAQKYGISISQIQRVVNGYCWSGRRKDEPRR